MISNVEPVVGDKRQREEDASEDIPATSEPTRTAQTIASQSSVKSEPNHEVNSHLTGNPVSSGQVNGADPQSSSAGGYDALFIGELQWVCLFNYFNLVKRVPEVFFS
jgi:hypothetical protein